MWQFFRRGTFTLHKEITIVVIVKLIAIFILWYFCFSHPVKDHLTTRMMQQHISGKHDGPAFLLLAMTRTLCGNDGIGVIEA